jgi:hypothetical protein
MLNVVMLSIVMQSYAMLSAVRLNAVILSVVMLSSRGVIHSAIIRFTVETVAGFFQLKRQICFIL